MWVYVPQVGLGKTRDPLFVHAECTPSFDTPATHSPTRIYIRASKKAYLNAYIYVPQVGIGKAGDPLFLHAGCAPSPDTPATHSQMHISIRAESVVDAYIYVTQAG